MTRFLKKQRKSKRDIIAIIKGISLPDISETTIYMKLYKQFKILLLRKSHIIKHQVQTQTERDILKAALPIMRRIRDDKDFGAVFNKKMENSKNNDPSFTLGFLEFIESL